MITFCHFVHKGNKIEFKSNILTVAEGNRSINSKISILFWKGNKEHGSLFLGLHISLMPKFALTSGRI